MLLQLQQLVLVALQQLVLVALHPTGVRMSFALRLDVVAILIEQDRIVVILVIDGAPVFGGRKGFQIYLSHGLTLSEARACQASRLVPVVTCSQFAISFARPSAM